MRIENIGRAIIVDTPECFNMTVTFIHPYRRVDGKAVSIPGYEGKRYLDKSKDIVTNKIYKDFKKDGETLLAFSRRFKLEFGEYKYPVTLCVPGAFVENQFVFPEDLE